MRRCGPAEWASVYSRGGCAEDVVEEGGGGPFPVEWLQDGEAIRLVAERVEATEHRARAQQAVVEDLDVISDGLILAAGTV